MTGSCVLLGRVRENTTRILIPRLCLGPQENCQYFKVRNRAWLRGWRQRPDGGMCVWRKGVRTTDKSVGRTGQRLINQTSPSASLLRQRSAVSRSFVRFWPGFCVSSPCDHIVKALHQKTASIPFTDFPMAAAWGVSEGESGEGSMELINPISSPHPLSHSTLHAHTAYSCALRPLVTLSLGSIL